MIDKKNQNQIKTKIDSRGYWTHPLTRLEESLIIDSEDFNRDLRTEGLAWARIITKPVLKHIKESKANFGNSVIGLLGPPGRGKSQVALRLLKYCITQSQTLLNIENPETFMVFSKTELTKILDQITFGAVGFQDEDLSESGIDSQAMKDSIKNAREVFFRGNQFDFIIASANPKLWIKNLFDIILKPIGRKTNSEGRQQTLCKVYSGETLKPLGLMEVLLLEENDPLRLEHKKLEKIFKDQIKNHKGYSSFGMDPQQLRKNACHLSQLAFKMDKIKISNLSESQKRKLKHYGKENLKSSFTTHAEAFPGTENQQRRIIEEVWKDIQNAKTELKTEIETKKEELRKEKEALKSKEREEKEKQLQEEKAAKLKAKEEKAANKQIEKQKHQDFLIKQRQDHEEIINECIYFYDLYSRKVSNLILRHYFLEKRIHKNNIDYFLAKTLETVILNQSDENIAVEEDLLYSVNEDDKFVFDEKLALEKIAKKTLQGKTKVSWHVMVEVFQLKKGGLTNDTILEKLADKDIIIAKSSLNNYNKRIQGELSRLMGAVYEQFRTEQLKKLYPKAKVTLGGKKSEVDILIYHSKKHVDIISAKCYRISPSKGSETFLITKELKPELNEAKKRKQNFILDFYNPLNHTHNTCEIEVSKVNNKSKVTITYKSELTVKY